MRARLLSLSFLIAILSTGLASLLLQPILLNAIEIARRGGDEGTIEQVYRVARFWPFHLAAGILGITLVAYGALFFLVVRPWRMALSGNRPVAALENASSAIPGGEISGDPLQWALSHLSMALRQEKALTQEQLQTLIQMNETLARMQTELIATERLASIGRLAAGVAHEVGNPLAGILGYLSLIKSKKPSAVDLDEWVGHIEGEVHRIHQIVKSLLLMGRPVKGQVEPVDLHAVMDSCLRLLVTGPDFREVEIQVNVPSGTLVLAEAGPLTQVLLNLLLNAAQAMSGRGRVQLDTRFENDWVNLLVIDTGPGLSMQAREHLFEPFFTTKPEGKGTGVGLVVSRHLMRGMGGDLIPIVTEGAGACFVVKLPAISIDAHAESKNLVT